MVKNKTLHKNVGFFVPLRYINSKNMDTNVQEIWRDIPNYEGFQASNLGRIKRLGRWQNMKGVKYYFPEKLLALNYCGKGYLKCDLCVGNYQKHNHKVHRLVAMAFIPNPNNLPQINHINGIKDDNRLENLEWCNNSHNQKHAYANGLNIPKSGPNHMWSKTVINTQYGTFYHSAKEAYLASGVSYTYYTFCYKLKNRTKNNTNFVYA